MFGPFKIFLYLIESVKLKRSEMTAVQTQRWAYIYWAMESWFHNTSFIIVNNTLGEAICVIQNRLICMFAITFHASLLSELTYYVLSDASHFPDPVQSLCCLQTPYLMLLLWSLSVPKSKHCSWRQIVVESFIQFRSGLQINLDWAGKCLRRLGLWRGSVSHLNTLSK